MNRYRTRNGFLPWALVPYPATSGIPTMWCRGSRHQSPAPHGRYSRCCRIWHKSPWQEPISGPVSVHTDGLPGEPSSRCTNPVQSFRPPDGVRPSWLPSRIETDHSADQQWPSSQWSNRPARTAGARKRNCDQNQEASPGWPERLLVRHLLLPSQDSLLPFIEEANKQQENEEEHASQCHRPYFPQGHGPGIHKHSFQIKYHKEHAYQVEVHVPSLPRILCWEDTALVRD